MNEQMPLTVDDLYRMNPMQLLLPSEVARVFRVNPKTVTRWTKAGKLKAIRTLGGHRRYRVEVVLEKLEEDISRDADTAKNS